MALKAAELSKLTAFAEELFDTKLSIVEFQQQQQTTNESLHKVILRNEEISNQQTSLENWVEKYLPLKL